MIIIRPIEMADYDALHRIAIESGHGFTSLPVSESILKKRIAHSEASFKTKVTEAGAQGYLFVMEDTQTGEVVGTTAIEAAVGLDDAFYHYHLGKVVHNSRELNIYNTVETLTLCNDYTGATEICTLFLNESHRKNSNGRFLSRCRFMFMAEHPERFSECVIAEMRGVSDTNGCSPFYQWLKEHFLSIEFTEADYLTGTGNKGFIAELMPKYPVYVNLLSDEAQQVINKVHKNTVPAIRLLEAEGFTRRGYVDIFDAGPTVEAEKSSIRTVRESKKYQVVINNIETNKPNRLDKYIICNTKVATFRATQAPLTLGETENQVIINNEVAKAIQVQAGDWVRIITN
ncbi:MAG: arginine N-succinyltransferase [Colwellia sp.]